MIVSASRRTDIPAFYAQWLLNRLEAREVLVPEPYRPGHLGRVRLSPDVVDCLVLWTKDPGPMLDKLDRLDELGYRYYFQFTLTPYGRNVEPGLPDKKTLEETFRALSRRCGKERVIWRYDPVFLDENHTIPWHLEQFERLCEGLVDSTCRCVFSFIDLYRGSGFRVMTQGEMEAVAAGFSAIAKGYGLPLFTCAETIDLSAWGIGHGACIDRGVVETIVGCPITGKKDKNQRPACGCIAAVDIGAYDTCTHGCAYCYGTSSARAAARREAAHDPASPLLTGWPRGDEIIRDRTTGSQKQLQTTLF